jgi:hypothetical protein
VAQGFQMDGNGQFVHPNGCRIIKTTGDIFPWGRMDASGNVVRYYLPKEHCLHTAPLVIESEVWGLIDDKPEKYALILLDVSGKPKEMTGTLLLQLKKQQRLNIYTAAYRLLLNDDNKS